MPVYDFSSGFSGLNSGIDSLGSAIDRTNKQQSLVALGQALKNNDLPTAAQIALASGNPEVGISLFKLGKQQQQQDQLNRMDAAGYPGSSPMPVVPSTTQGDASNGPATTPKVAGEGGISPLAPKAAQYFLGSGTVTNPLGAAALAAGFQAESGYDPSAVAKADGPHGSDAVNIGQWNGPRAINFRNFYQANKLDPNDPATGLAFSKYELQNDPQYSGVLQGLNNAKTPEE